MPSSLLASRTSFRSCWTLWSSCARISSSVSRAFLRNALRIFLPPSHRGGGNLEPGSTQVNGGLGKNHAPEVVDIGIRYPDPHQVPGSRLAAHRDLAIDLGRLVAPPSDERSAPLSVPFDQHVKLAPDLPA